MKRVKFLAVAAVLLISFLFVFDTAWAWESCWSPWELGEPPISAVDVNPCANDPLASDGLCVINPDVPYQITLPCQTVPIDLNLGAGGRHIYFSYEREPDKDPVTDLFFVDLSPYRCPSGYQFVNGDLNWGAGGNHIYTCLGRSRHLPPITDLWVVAGSSPTAWENCPEGFTPLYWNLNNGNNGAFIYPCIMTEDRRLGQISVSTLAYMD